MAKQEYLVQRKVITWEQVRVDAKSFDDAVELAEDSDGWDEVYDASEATDTYWVKNEDTNEAKIREGEFAEWEDAI
jgi:hypothetical protein